MSQVFLFISAVCQIYAIACMVRIILTWIPNTENSDFTKFLASLTDPYLNLFRGIHFLQIGIIDFSPVLALGLLSLGSSFFSTFALTGRISLFGIFRTIIFFIFSIITSVINLFIVFLVIRLIYDFIQSAHYSSIWQQVDRFLNPIIARLVRFVFSTGTFTYRQSLLIALTILVLLRIFLAFLTKML